MKIIKRILCVSVIAAALAETLFCEDNLKPKMVRIPGQDYEMMTTEVTQGLYESVMGENPSYFRNDNEDLDDEERDNLPKNTKNNPVECVSWYDAIYFCNKLSEKFGFTPVYEVDGKTDVTTWNYTPHEGNSISGNVTQNANANGFRLPTVEEWQYAARGGQNYKYAGSNDIDEVGWYENNSGDKTHPVAQKKANGYGLYDMSGNVWEWCWGVSPDYSRYRCRCGGSWDYDAYYCWVDGGSSYYADFRCSNLGFRLVRTIK